MDPQDQTLVASIDIEDETAVMDVDIADESGGGQVDTNNKATNALKIDESRVANPCAKSIRELDDDDMAMLRTIDMLFVNDFKGAAKALEPKSDVDALYAVGLGVLNLMKAMSTFNPDDINFTTKLLQRAASIASIQYKLATLKSTSFRLTRWIKGSAIFIAQSTGLQELPVLNYGQLRSTVIKAESGLLTSMMLLFEESVVDFMKAGWSLRQSNKCYHQAWQNYQKLIKENPASIPENIDKHTLSGILFGIGANNTMLSILPQKLLKIISLFGFSGERELGFSLLDSAVTSSGTRAPVAEMFLGAFHSVTSSLVPTVLGPITIPMSIKYLQIALNRYPNSAFHLLLMGRTCRTARDLLLADEFFTRAHSAQDEWKELQMLCNYEMSMNGLIQLQWVKSAQLFTQLKIASYWSSAFFVYAEATCLAMIDEFNPDPNYLKDSDRTTLWQSLYSSAPKWVKRKFGGKIISVEQYVMRKVKLFERTHFRRILVPGLELVYLWNGYSFMSLNQLKQARELVQRTLTQYESEYQQRQQQQQSQPIHQSKSKISLHAIEATPGALARTLSGLSAVLTSTPHKSQELPLDETEIDLDNVQQREQQAIEEEDDIFVDRMGVLKLISAAIDQELGQIDEAVQTLQWILDREKLFKDETWVPAFANYQMGMAIFSRLTITTTTTTPSPTSHTMSTDELLQNTKLHLVRARDKFTDYNFEYRLAMRIHLALLQLDQWIKTGTVPSLAMPPANALIEQYKKEDRQ